MAKYLLIAAIVFSFATAILGYMNHETLVTAKTTLEQTTTKLTAATADLGKTKTSLKEKTATLDATEAEKVKLAADLLAAQGEATTAKGQIDEAKASIAAKDAEIAALNVKINKIGGTPQPGGPDPMLIVEQLRQQIAEQEAQIASLKEQLESSRSKFVVLEEKEKARAASVMRKGLEGRVLAVNPAWNFVVISIGDKQGVVSNAEMLLKRGDQFLGKVRITSVEPSTSIADIVANTLPEGVSVQPGDTVIFQGAE